MAGRITLSRASARRLDDVLQALIMKLTDLQKEEFERKGYLFFSGLFSPAESAVLTQAVTELAAGRLNPGREPNQGDAIGILHGAHRRSEVFYQLSRHPRLVGPVEQLLSSRVYIYQCRLNLKTAVGTGLSLGYPWHQDFPAWYWRDGLPEPKAVVAMTFLDEVTPCNAPLMLIPGSHKEQMIGWADQNAGMDKYFIVTPDLLTEAFKRGGIEAQLGPAGSVLFMHCNLLHGSNDNISPLSRFLCSTAYCAAGNHPTKFTRTEDYTPRDFTPLAVLADDCLLGPVGLD